MSEAVKRTLLSEGKSGVEALITGGGVAGLEFFLGGGMNPIAENLPIFGGMPIFIYTGLVAGGASFVESQLFSVLPQAIQNKYVNLLSSVPMLAKPIITGGVAIGVNVLIDYLYGSGTLTGGLDIQIFGFTVLAELIALQVKHTSLNEIESFVFGNIEKVPEHTRHNVVARDKGLFMGLF